MRVFTTPRAHLKLDSFSFQDRSPTQRFRSESYLGYEVCNASETVRLLLVVTRNSSSHEVDVRDDFDTHALASNIYIAYCTSSALQAASSRRWSNIVRGEDVDKHDPGVGHNLWSCSNIYQPIMLLRGLWYRPHREHVRLGALITPSVVGNQ